MTDLSTPTHLRALVEALPFGDQCAWHDGGIRRGIVEVVPPGNQVTIFTSVTVPGLAAHRALIAAMGPPVVLALADHLEALAAFHEPAVGQPIAFDEVGQAIRRLLRTRDALEAAIHRTPPARAPEGQQG